jgi:hypothetical protein
VAAARLFVDEYLIAGVYFERCVQTGKLYPVPPEATIRVSDGDRKLMAGHLSSDDYGRASEVAATAKLALRTLRRVDPVRGPFPVLDGAVDVLVKGGASLASGGARSPASADRRVAGRSDPSRRFGALSPAFRPSPAKRPEGHSLRLPRVGSRTSRSHRPMPKFLMPCSFWALPSFFTGRCRLSRDGAESFDWNVRNFFSLHYVRQLLGAPFAQQLVMP